MKRHFLAAASVAAVVFASNPAAAAEVVITYYGKVSNGYDYAGDFGKANTDLTGKQFVATYVYQSNVQPTYYDNYARWTASDDGKGGPLTFASLVVDGKGVKFPDAVYSSVSLSKFYTGFPGSNEISTLAVTEKYTAPSIFEASFFNIYSRVLEGEVFPVYGNFFYTSDKLLDSGVYSRQRFQLVNGSAIRQELYSFVNFDFDRVTISATGAVPEPATWAMMILGFGAIGYSLRRKTVLRFV